MFTQLMSVLSIAILGVIFATMLYRQMKSVSEGTKRMKEIALAIRQGAKAFLSEEYRAISKVVVVIAIIFGTMLQVSSAISFIIGVFVSGLAGYIGMKASTYANVRTTNTAKTTQNVGSTLKVALKGGSIMGLCVSCFALIGLVIVFFIFNYQLSSLGMVPNILGIELEPFSTTLATYVFGCSIVAMFNRVGGGVYTKAADMGADLVGKNEEDIPEDDPRNPAVIADCVGDNVGDTAGLGSDLLESYMGAIVSGIVLTIFLFIRYNTLGLEFDQTLFESLIMYPILFSATGLLSCIIGLLYIFGKKDSNNPSRELNMLTVFSAVLTGVLSLILTYYLFEDVSIGDLPFKFGIWSPYISSIIGIVAGILVGTITQYYTSYEYSPTKKIADFSKQGAAITITTGMAVGMKSVFLPAVVISIALMASYFVSGALGISMSAVGMLSFITAMVSIDSYGPISDNAGGIAEMAELNAEVRKITDQLDAVGNTTAAIGKGFSIGSAAFAAVSLITSYSYAYTSIENEVTLNAIDPMILGGIIIGAGIAKYFTGQLIDSVNTPAQKMVSEVRRQFDDGVRNGTKKPDYTRCILIATKGALHEMKKPSLIAILIPVIGGFALGANFVAGILISLTVSAIMEAIFTGNAGGAWDNAKKYVESIGMKGSPVHHATVVGDTVGDPLKDTACPALNILIKITATISIILVPIFSKYNVIEYAQLLIGKYF